MPTPSNIREKKQNQTREKKLKCNCHWCLHPDYAGEHVNTCPEYTPSKPKDWEDQLNEVGFNHPPLHQFIKNNFINKKELEGKLEGMKVTYEPKTAAEGDSDYPEFRAIREGYNKALSDCLKLIKEL